MKSHIALVGFMAAGKTTVGRRLARELGLPFVDSDALIVERHGPIAVIFAERGEPAFRAAEHDAIAHAFAGVASVVALGGGALTHPPTRELARVHALRIYLDLPPAALAARLRRARHVRPLMGRVPTLETVRELLEHRAPAYREAEIVVAGDRGSPSRFARDIAARVRAHPAFTAPPQPPREVAS